MTRGIHEAVAELRKHPETPVLVEVDGFVFEIRPAKKRTAADLFREVGPWEGDDAEEILRKLREAREAGGSREIPSY